MATEQNNTENQKACNPRSQTLTSKARIHFNIAQKLSEETEMGQYGYKQRVYTDDISIALSYKVSREEVFLSAFATNFIDDPYNLSLVLSRENSDDGCLSLAMHKNGGA